MSGLIWIQTVCISYQQVTLVGKGLTLFPVEPAHTRRNWDSSLLNWMEKKNSARLINLYNLSRAG